MIYIYIYIYNVGLDNVKRNFQGVDSMVSVYVQAFMDTHKLHYCLLSREVKVLGTFSNICLKQAYNHPSQCHSLLC